MDIRLEQRTDYKEVELLIREAFWNIYRPGCYEHFIVHNLRYDSSFINQLDYIIEEDERIIAHIAYSSNKLITDENTETVVTLGPICVHPDYQKQGYARKLMEHTLNLAQEMGIPYVFVVGIENFYSKFGFEDASKYGIQYNDLTGDTPFFMVKVFDDEKIKSINGVYKDNELFKVDKEELDKFDEKFPPKQKEKHEGQLDF
ncbi:MAG: GNAT family N-acetyltransferase [Methanosphaera sp. rholeuAM6]|nr:MAG: GNAT family N-acetyltransferase [Methanosphaera sp. rholeuAM6]